MRIRRLIFGLILFSALGSRAGEVLDRIVATVNGHIILQSELEDEVRYEGFMTGRTLQNITPEDRKAALDRLIDQELLREQMRIAEFRLTSPDEIETQLETLQHDYAQDHPGQGWSVALASYRLSEGDVKNHIAVELDQLRLIDARLRPSIQIDAAAVETYYKEQLVPELHRSGGEQLSLAQAAPKIREILIQQKIDQLLSSWLQTLHSQAQIRMLASDSAGSRVQGQ
jgi:peptidyl-prolyl cis-trans isomerase SurA